MVTSNKNVSITLFDRIRTNWKSGLTVSFVSIPLSISLAIAGGASPVMGIITAIWAGVIAGIFGGSRYNIVGPTGALSGLLAAYALTHGMGALPMLAIATGVIILVSFALKLERYLIFIPASTIQGFVLGVAFIIGLNQLNYALGLKGLPSHEQFIQNIIESFRHIGQSSLPTFIVFLAFTIGIFLLAKRFPKFPGIITLTPFGLLLGYLSTHNLIPFRLQTLGEKFPDMSLKIFTLPTFHFDLPLFSAAIGVALIAIIETMLSAKIADGMTRTKHNKRREMLALGLANVGCGLAGGLPATAALARTSLNIRTGADHNTSAVISSISIAVISFALLVWFNYLPMAVIASILTFVAIRMVEKEHLIRMFKIDKKSFFLALLVAIISIVSDPMLGILLGTSVSLFFFLDKLSYGHYDLVANDIRKKIVAKISGEKMGIEKINANTHTFVYSIKGHLTYIDSQAHLSRFEEMEGRYKNVVLRLRELYFIDSDGVDAFDEIVEMIESKKKKLIITGITQVIGHMLSQSKHFPALQKKGLVFESTSEALKFLGFDLKVKKA